jgi:hypothetical protein
VFDTHESVEHMVLPSEADGVRSLIAKLKPDIVTVAPLLVGIFRFVYVTTGESYVKIPAAVPTTAEIVSLTLCACFDPCPASMLWQSTEVYEFHFVVPQIVVAMAVEGVASSTPKLNPRIVTEVPALVGLLGSSETDTAGESYVNMFRTVPITELIVVMTSILDPSPWLL